MEKKNEEVRQEKMELQTIEERLQSLIESYAFEIEEETKNLKKYKDELENVLKESDCLSMVDNSRIGSLQKNCRKNGKRNLFEERIFTRFKIYERRKLK